MKSLVVAICSLLALGIAAGASEANPNGIVLAQYGPPQAQDPDARWNRGDREGDVRRFNREERGERGERRDDGDDRRGDGDGRRRDRDERGNWDRDRGRDRDWDRRRDGDRDRDRYDGRPRRNCFTDDDGNRFCRN